jgi:hypothetical protein
MTPSPAEPVTVLLSTYNGVAWLPEQLASLAAQTHPWSLLWRDDGSTDGTLALMRQTQGTEAATGGRLGVLASFMALLREARGNVAFCDQDDVWRPEKLARGAAAVVGDAPALYCARQILVDPKLRPLGESEVIRHAGFPAALTQNVAAGCTIVMNEAARRLVAASAPPPSTLHDWWSYLVVSAAGGRIVCDPEPTLLYRQHGGNAVGAPISRPRRALAAIRRGPGVFMDHLRDHVAALQAPGAVLTDPARRVLRDTDAALRGGIARRLAVLRHPGLVRQTAIETAVFRLWFLLG